MEISAEARKGKPYAWTTWLTGTVSGEKSCAWATWFKMHYRTYAKRPQDNEGQLLAWQAEHAEMVRAEAARLEADGWTVSVESQNSFTYRGEAALVGGKPDIIALRGQLQEESGDVLGPEPEALIVDCKTGKERDSDAVQVAIYLMLAPKDLSSLEGRALRGEVAYKARRRPVTMDDVARLRPLIVGQVLLAAGGIAPARVPSARECAWCDIAECPDRIAADTSTSEAAVAGAEF